MKDKFTSAVNRVVRNGNCTGCGGCALISPRIDMRLDEDGDLRPFIGAGRSDPDEVRLFAATCPGRSVRAPESDRPFDSPIFGSHVSVWRSWATDEEVREAGSSGGVLTALAAWLVESGRTRAVIGSQPSSERPTTSVPLHITSKVEAIRAAGSRYAPVCNLPLLTRHSEENALIGKPCEASAAHQFFEATGVSRSDRPILLSFFCAGTPSQHATDALVEKLGIPTEAVTALRYRGNGWPGTFQVRSATDIRQLSYDESWGQHLGRRLPWRCKLCVDGTGGHADIAVGDYWQCDDRGYPIFDDAEGDSVVIARTLRGHDLLMEAARCGVLLIEEVDIATVNPVQPLQVERKRALAGRLFGRVIAGKRIPRYTGYRLLALAVRKPRKAVRAAAGTWLRTIRN